MQTRQYVFGTLSGATLFLLAGYLANTGVINWSLALVGASMFAISLASWGLDWLKAPKATTPVLASQPLKARGQH